MQFDLKYRDLTAKRFSAVDTHANLNIKNNSTLTAVSKVDGNLFISFVFSCNYEPNVGFIQLGGDLTISAESDVIDEAFEGWEKSDRKNLPAEIAGKVHNVILSNCIIEATILSRYIQLPPPIPMPRVMMGKKPENSTNSLDTTNSYIR